MTTFQTKRPTILAAEEILNGYFGVLDHGFVSLVDYCGGDEAIERSARTSYSFGNRKKSATRGLIRYLRRHEHCYRGDMEVLTTSGWKRWQDCTDTEHFLVPDPHTRTLRVEECAVLQFECDDELVTFKNERMSFAVTRQHRMWFKDKYKTTDGFAIHRASGVPHWGHFDSMTGYAWVEPRGDKCPLHQFYGFYLGDGRRASRNRIVFHLKKSRKLDYLKDVLDRLALPYKTRSSTSTTGAQVVWVDISTLQDSEWMQGGAEEKSFPYPLHSLPAEQIRGLYDGLVNSDGSVSSTRPQTHYSSSSPDLLRLFETLAAMQGIDAHRTLHTGSAAYTGRSQTLESRGQYWGRSWFRGTVYCATTSSGLLVVRGDEREFGFICGNSSPTEFTELVFHLGMPLFVARQLVRHRTASLNELSGRYSLMPMLFYTPEQKDFSLQSTTNKQGRGEHADELLYAEAVERWNAQRNQGAEDYQWMTAEGVARELARIDLPLSTYTFMYWKVDLRNLLHFLGLRTDSHAQYEIRAFADVIAGMVKRVAPLSYEAWLDYDVGAETFSYQEMVMLRRMLAVTDDSTRVIPSSLECSSDHAQTEFSLADREWEEFVAKFAPKALPDFDLDLTEMRDASYFEERIASAVPDVDGR